MTYFFDIKVGYSGNGDAWLDAATDPLFEAFQGNVSPGVQHGAYGASGCIDADSLGDVLGYVADVVEMLRNIGAEPLAMKVEREEESIPA